MPLHRLREFGCHLKELDIIDESKLTLAQMYKFTHIIYGEAAEKWPRPDVDFDGFMTALVEANKNMPKTFCPAEKSERDWIAPKGVSKAFNKGGKCIIS